jgi:SAM-dependent methyltransferase
MNPICPLCGQTLALWLSMPIDSQRRQPTAHGTVYRCPVCSFGMTWPRPSREEVQDFYQFDYYTHCQSQPGETESVPLLDKVRLHLAWRFDRGEDLDQMMMDRLAKSPSSEVCDIGCGSAALLDRLARLGHSVVGVDPDPVSVANGVDRGLQVYEGSAENLPDAVASRRFDVVTLSHVLEHTLDPLEAVKQAASILRPGGLLVCEVPNNAHLGLDFVGTAWSWLDIPRHINFFVPENLVAITQRVGLMPIRLFHVGFCRHFSNSWINTEIQIYDAVVQYGDSAACRRNSKLRAWSLLARTAMASKARKYDSVGILAEKA